MSIDGSPPTKASPSRSTSRSLLVRPSAHHMQRELEESTKNLEIEKRKYLELDEQFKKVSRTFNQQKQQLNGLLRATHSNSVTSLPIKASNLLHFANKLNSQNQAVLAKIRQVQDEITRLRKQKTKYIKLAEKLNQDLKVMEGNVREADSKIDGLKTTNDFIKTQILDYRNRTICDIKDFKQSFTNLSQNYFTQRKGLDSQLRKSRQKESNDIIINALPILKERLRRLINRNKQKMKIVNDYKKACGEIRKMFLIMKQYKGKDDIDFIAREFVQKQNTIYKLEQYIDKLQSRLESLKSKRNNIQDQTSTIEKQLGKVDDKIASKRTKRQAAQMLKMDIKNINNQISNFQDKLSKFAPNFQDILLKLRQSKYNTEGDNPAQIKINFSLLKGNLLQILGQLQKYIVIIRPPPINQQSRASLKEISIDQKDKELDKDKGEKMPLPPEDNQIIKNEILNYNKLKQIAQDIIYKKSSFIDNRKR